jgi:hypothetical protein
MVENQALILNGMKEICKVLGNRSEATVLALKRQYPSMPIRKERHIWVSEREALLEWFRLYVQGRLPEDEPEPQEQEPDQDPEWAQGKAKAELIFFAKEQLGFTGVNQNQTRPAIIDAIRQEMQRQEKQ